jgi:four helix bundle protein
MRDSDPAALDPSALFAHERLTVYRRALEFTADVEAIVPELEAGRRDLVDQLRRASSSIVLNIAEGAGEFSQAEKARSYRMARRSATECAAVLDLFQTLKLCDPERVHRSRMLLWEVVSMLTKMVTNIADGGGAVREGALEGWGDVEADSVRQGKGKGKGKGKGEEGEGHHA